MSLFQTVKSANQTSNISEEPGGCDVNTAWEEYI